MKITRIEQFFPRKRTRLVQVSTDEGLVGWGETTLEGRPESTCAAVDEMAENISSARIRCALSIIGSTSTARRSSALARW